MRGLDHADTQVTLGRTLAKSTFSIQHSAFNIKGQSKPRQIPDAASIVSFMQPTTQWKVRMDRSRNRAEQMARLK